MSRATIILSNAETRERATHWVKIAPAGTVFELRESKRTTPQNAAFWARMTEIARTVAWHGVKLSAEDWRFVFVASLNGELRIVPNLSGDGFVNLGRSSSNLTKGEFSDLLELTNKFAAEHGIVFADGLGQEKTDATTLSEQKES